MGWLRRKATRTTATDTRRAEPCTASDTWWIRTVFAIGMRDQQGVPFEDAQAKFDSWLTDVRAGDHAAVHELKAALAVPPDGWFTFGTHADQDVALEFWGSDGGVPLWERPVRGPADSAVHDPSCSLAKNPCARCLERLAG